MRNLDGMSQDASKPLTASPDGRMEPGMTCVFTVQEKDHEPRQSKSNSTLFDGLTI